jgi:hypothetical protein
MPPGRHGTLHKSSQDNDTQRSVTLNNDAQHDDNQHNNTQKNNY